MKKPSNGKSRYEINCDKITISVDGKEVIELTGKEKEELIDMFNNGGINDEKYDVSKKYDDSYNIKVDFNNFITKLYMREKDNYVFFFDVGDEQHYRYELKEEVHDKIMEYIKK